MLKTGQFVEVEQPSMLSRDPKGRVTEVNDDQALVEFKDGSSAWYDHDQLEPLPADEMAPF